MANLKTIEEIIQVIKQKTEEAINSFAQLDIEDFKIICKEYISGIELYLTEMEDRASLAQRIQMIGTLMHGDQTKFQNLLQLSHNFENAFNNFLGREVPLTWVNSVGDIYIASEETLAKLYSKAKVDKTKSSRTYRGTLKGVNQSMFENNHLNPKLAKLQADINESAKNKKALLLEGRRRYHKSDKMQYAKKHQDQIKNIYWATTDPSDGQPKGWSNQIVSSGYITEGYVAMVINTAHDQLNEVISFPANQPPYILEYQIYIKELAEKAAEGDAIPGIIKGDINANESGSIQLAIKGGHRFSTASISGNIAIAYAMLLFPQNFPNRQSVKEALANLEKQYTAKWQQIFEAITGQVAQKIDSSALKLIFNL